MEEFSYQGRTLTGKAQLETDFLLFRGDERLKIWLNIRLREWTN
jgi:hypothetical protein